MQILGVCWLIYELMLLAVLSTVKSRARVHLRSVCVQAHWLRFWLISKDKKVPFLHMIVSYYHLYDEMIEWHFRLISSCWEYNAAISQNLSSEWLHYMLAFLRYQPVSASWTSTWHLWSFHCVFVDGRFFDDWIFKHLKGILLSTRSCELGTFYFLTSWQKKNAQAALHLWSNLKRWKPV